MTGYLEVTLPLTPWVLHNFRLSELTRWDEKAGLQRDAIRSR